MTDVAALLARIETLEIRFAHQEQMIEDLNKTVTAQWTEIDALRRKNEHLSDRLLQIETDRDQARQPDPPPPHY